jgi:hypothetical protein
MHVPGLMERVRMTGLGDVYLVTRVNEDEKEADLLPIVYGRPPVTGVAFLFLESIPGCSPPRLHPGE